MSKKSFKKKLTIVTLCALNAIKEALYLTVAPFFPLQMYNKNIDELWYGPLFV
jgi:hypothetical protein